MDVVKDSKFLIFVSGAVLQACAYFAARYYRNKNGKNVDEGFEDVSRIEEGTEKKILVLGLEGAGKSSILAHFTAPSISHNGVPEVSPTEGFNVVTLENDGITLKIYEIGGRKEVRKYWENYLQDTDVLVFVVDATQKLVTAAVELKRLLGDEKLAHVPVLVFANKQDLPGAMTVDQVADALDLKSITPSKHKVQVYPTQCTPGAKRIHISVTDAKLAVFNLTSL